MSMRKVYSMTTQEFSNEFDVLYNNIMSNQAPGLDEYEKSIFLTKAQEELVRDYFNSRNVKNAQGFDDNQKRQYDFSTLLSSITLPDFIDTYRALSVLNSVIYNTIFDSRAKIYIAPSDLFLVINESIEDSAKRRYSVLPISYDEYNRLMLKPYGLPLKRQAWRIISDRTSSLVGWGGKQVDSATFLFKSKYFKTIEIYIRLRSENNILKPDVIEGDNIVSISMYLPINNLVNYWSTYLSDDRGLKKAGLDKYLYPLNAVTGNFPSSGITEPTSFTISIAPAIMESGEVVSTPIFEIIGRFTGDIEYKMRYIKTPKPIILANLSDIQEGLSINGYNTVTECELPLNTHQEILQRAVELAKASYQGDLSSVIQTGNASGTDIGYVK
nr:MAG TPA: hypothetical protein [Crassvirales sp.]